MTPRDSVLLWGLIDWVELERIHGYVCASMPNTPLAEIQERTLALIEELVDDGLVEVGEVTIGRGFAAWTDSWQDAIARIREVYVDRFDEENVWPWYCWLNLTPEGVQVAEGLESADS